jgi:hypothetical protein
MDIEGAEYFALKGMEKTLNTFKPVILIEIVPLFLESFKIDPAFFQSFLQQTLNYAIFEYDNGQKKLIEVKSQITRDRNYILIHRDRIQDHKLLIA